MIDEAPEIRILAAVKADLADVDWEDKTGLAGVTVRHRRNRHPTKTEKPCVSVSWIGNEDAAVDAQYRNDWERVKHCKVDLQFDRELETEDSGDDPTGWLTLSRMKAAALEKLRDPDSRTAQLSDFVQEADTNPDEESKPDEGRLVQAIIVVYRVLTDQPNVLLAQGEDG